MSECPTVVYKPKYEYDKTLAPAYEIYPDPYLFCSGTFYEV